MDLAPLTPRPAIPQTLLWVGAFVIALGWLLSCGVTALITASPIFDRPYALRDYLLMAIPGALTLTGFLLFGHSVLLWSILPRSARWRWGLVTGLGGLLSFLIPWSLLGLAPVRAQLTEIETLGQFVPLGSFADVVLLGRSCGLWGALAIAGGLPLGLLQWLVLRAYVAHARWWILVCLSGNGWLFLLLGLLLWATHGFSFG